MIVKVSSKGQITIPAAERKRLGIEPNSRVEVVSRDGEVRIRPVKSVLEVAGSLKRYAKCPVPDWEEIRREARRTMARRAAADGRTADPGD